MSACDQCRGRLYACDTLSGFTTCVECARRGITAAIRLRDKGQALASTAHPDERAKVDAAIRKLAATGRPFSANDARRLHGVKGGVVGAAFGAASKAGLIKPAEGDVIERSTSPATHGHPVFRWIGSAA